MQVTDSNRMRSIPVAEAVDQDPFHHHQGLPGLLADRAPARPGYPGREEGRVRLRGPERHPHTGRPVAKDRSFYSGKRQKHGMNLQVIASPQGNVLWVSAPLPGQSTRRLSGSGHPARARGRRAGRPGRKGLPRSCACAHPVHRHGKLISQKPRTALTPGSAHPASARTLSSKPGASSAAALARRPASPKPSA